MNNITTLESAEAEKRKATLARTLQELVNTSREREDLQIEYLADPLDQVRSGIDRDITVHQLDYRTHGIHEVQAALAKIEDSTYGFCERCEELIPARRLDAVPWARLCRACQSDAEVHGSGMESSFRKTA